MTGRVAESYERQLWERLNALVDGVREEAGPAGVEAWRRSAGKAESDRAVPVA